MYRKAGFGGGVSIDRSVVASDVQTFNSFKIN